MKTIQLTPVGSELRSGAAGILITAFPDRARGQQFVQATLGDVIHARSGGETVSTKVDNATIEPPVNPQLDFRLERGQAPDAIHGRPGETGVLSVRLLEPSGDGVQGARIAWSVPNLRLKLIIPTDETGTSELELGLKSSGEYGLIANGDPVPNKSLPLGPLTAIASVAEDTYAHSVAGDQQIFVTRLERPEIVSFLDHDRGAYILSLLAGDPFELEVRDFPGPPKQVLPPEAYVSGIAPVDSSRGNQTPTEIRATVDLPDGRHEEPLYREPGQPHSLFYLTQRDIATPADLHTGATTVSAEYKAASATIPLYSWTHREVIEIRRALAYYDEMVGAALTAPDLTEPQAEELGVRALAIANARQLITDPALSELMHFFIGAGYLKILDSSQPLGPLNLEAPDAARMPFSRTPWSSKLEFASAREADEVYGARRAAIRYTLRRLVGVPAEALDNAYRFAKSLPNIIASAAYGGYTLFTGQTLDGQRATVLERVLGGVDLALMVVPVVKAFPKLGPLFRASRAAAVDAVAGAFQGARRASKIAKVGELVSWHRRTVVSAEARLAKRTALRIEAEARLGVLTQELSTTSTRAVKTREKLQSLIVGKQKRIAELGDAIAEATRLRDKHATDLASAQNLFARLQGIDLTIAELEQLKAQGKLPGAKDKINGYKAEWHYEQQITSELAGDGFVAGKRLFELETPYTRPHGGPGVSTSRTPSGSTTPIPTR